MNKFLKWWLFHSVCALVFYAILEATGQLYTQTNAGETLIVIGILASPIGAVIMFLAFRFWWFLFFTLFLGMVGKPFGYSGGPSYPSLGGKSKIKMNDGAMGSEIGGSEYRIDDSGWIYEAGSVGKRVGRLDKEGLWRSEEGDVVGRLDADGVLREHQEGFMSGVLESQEGTGQELGKAE